MTRFIATLISLFIAAAGHAAESDQLAEARRVFQRFVQLSHAYDVQVADLYAETASIKNKRLYPNGQVRELSMPAAQYKELIRNAMPVAKARGDRSTYSDLKFTVEGKGVRITGTRFSELKQYSSPMSLLVEPSASGSWLIVEELTESRP
jgi:hypothetical protein